MTARQSLSLDIESLFPGEPLKIGNQSVIIHPLNIEQIAVLSKKLRGIGAILSELDVTWENYNTQANLFKLAVVVIENFPDILEEAANINIADLKVLPIEVIVLILDKILDVNLKSKEALEKNFKSLTKKFQGEEPKTKKKSKK